MIWKQVALSMIINWTETYPFSLDYLKFTYFLVLGTLFTTLVASVSDTAVSIADIQQGPELLEEK